MNAALLLIPLFLIRYGLMALFGGDALRRAAHFPEMVGAERAFYWLYQLSSLVLFVLPFFLAVDTASRLFIPGAAVYALGVIMLTAATVDFSKPQPTGFRKTGTYRFSRNPMYVGYALYFLGCVFLAASWALFAAFCLFQISTHFMILAEERWCLKEFGEGYREYMGKVRRYINLAKSLTILLTYV
jgi:protein-S-isoprenylcysteine O-methyltransferase Ste14